MLVALKAMGTLGVNEVVSTVVAMLAFLAVWHLFDWRYKKSVPRDSQP
jgi:hypothetical protein